MYKLATLSIYLAAQYAASSPLPQETGTPTTAAAAPTDGATIVSGFVPSPGGPPAETLYAVTASDQTYLAGIATVTSTAEDGSATAVVQKDVFVLTGDSIDYYQFNGTDFVLQAVNCDVSSDGSSATCNGTSIDIMSGGVGLQRAEGQTFSGASSGVTAYLPTGTADPSGVSLASAAPSLVESASVFLASYLSSVQSVVSEATAGVQSEISEATAGIGSATAIPTGSSDAAIQTGAPETDTGLAAGGFTFTSDDDVGITGGGNTGGATGVAF